MKKIVFFMIIASLIPNIVLGQDYSFSRNDGKTNIRLNLDGKTYEGSFHDKDIFDSKDLDLPYPPKKNKDDERDFGDHDHDNTPEEFYYSGASNDSGESWGENELNGLYEDKVHMQEYEDKMIKDDAKSCLNEMNQLLADDCIDAIKIRNVIDKYLHLSNYQRDLLGEHGRNTFEKLINQLEIKGLMYLEYSYMATNIKNFHFKNVDKKAMKLSYEDTYNKYLTQFLSKEEFEKAKVEYEKYENANKVKDVLEKIRNHRPQQKEPTSGDGCHLAIQKVRKSMVDNYKVGAMTVKNLKEAQELLGNDYVPKSTLLEQLVKGINNGYEAVNVKEILVKAFSGNWKEASSRYAQMANEKLIDPLKDCVVGLGSSLSVQYKTTKRVLNFEDTYVKVMSDIMKENEKATNAVLRGERPNIDFIKASRKNTIMIKKGINKIIN